MTARNVEARIVKLEARRRHDDEMLVLWCRPNDDKQAVIDAANFARGDRVIVAPWYGTEPPPKPRWCRDFPLGATPEQQKKCLIRYIEEITSEYERRQDPEWLAAKEYRVAHELSDGDLWYELLKVET